MCIAPRLRASTVEKTYRSSVLCGDMHFVLYIHYNNVHEHVSTVKVQTPKMETTLFFINFGSQEVGLE